MNKHIKYDPFRDNFAKLVNEMETLYQQIENVSMLHDAMNKRIEEIEKFIKYESYKPALQLIDDLSSSSEILNKIEKRFHKIERQLNLLLSEGIENESSPISSWKEKILAKF